MAQYQSFPDAAGDSRTLEKLKALRLPNLSGRSFLDVGCNEGFFCGFAEYQGATRSVGIDHSEGFIRRARDRFPNCEFHRQGWDSLPSGQFDIILLASALHYAEDQPALIRTLVESLSDEGTLVLELGVVSSRKPVWSKVKRGIDERYFASMPMLRKVLADYAWKWMGPSIAQDGDPVARHVIHVSRRRPMAYLLMQPPGYGKSSIAAGLFPRAGIDVVSGDEQIGQVAAGKLDVPESLRALIAENYSPFHIDRIIQNIFERKLGAELVALWLGQAKGADIALDVYVPASYQDTVKRLLEERGYLPVSLSWERVGPAPLPEAVMTEQAEAFYLSMLDAPTGERPASVRKHRWEPSGFVDELAVEDGQLLIRGWAVDGDGALPGSILVKLGRRTVPIGVLERQLRPDVQRYLDLPHALVGYRASIEVPDIGSPADLPGGFKVFARDGAPFKLGRDVAAKLPGWGR